MNSRFVLRTLVILAVVAACLAAPADNNNKVVANDVISNSVLPESEERAVKADPSIEPEKDTDAEKPTSYNDYISSIFQIPISILQAVRDLFTGGARQV